MRAIDDMISQKVVNQKGCWAEYTILDIYKLYNIYSEFFAIYIYIYTSKGQQSQTWVLFSKSGSNI